MAAPTKILGLTALGDLVVGAVLALVGVGSDNDVLAIVGVVLLLSGAGMLAYVAWSRRDTPTT